ncbi:MAG: alpha/beta hydrolase [Myxococcales bacterium]|nr:alpha/beta hydrolase [Myxococcales bacterium]MCB9712604.1 alpha/beta hydrolase [Myxococcales bacterium]
MLDPLVDASPWLLLASGAAFFLLMANALWPLRHPLLMFQSFLAGLTVRETAAHHLAWQVPFVGLLVVAGALREWLGIVGLVLVGLSWVGLVGLFVVAHRDAARVRAQGDPGQEPAPSYPVAYLAAPPLAFLRRDISVQRGIVFGEAEGVRLRLDVFRPRAQGRLRPAVVQVHGGGWVSGFKRAQGVPLLGQLASLGWVGFNIDYRLGPRAAFPAHLVDVKRAVAWVREHAEEHGVDPSFIVITGGSAGGHLVALAGLTANDPEYQPGFETADTSVAAVAAFYGMYDLTERRRPLGRIVRAFLERWVLKKRYDEDPEAFVRASPIERVHPDAPPFYVVHGTADTIIPVAGARAFVARLREVSRAPVYYLEVPGAGHAFDILPSLRTGATVEVITAKLVALHREHARRQQTETSPSATA